LGRGRSTGKTAGEREGGEKKTDYQSRKRRWEGWARKGEKERKELHKGHPWKEKKKGRSGGKKKVELGNGVGVKRPYLSERNNNNKGKGGKIYIFKREKKTGKEKKKPFSTVGQKGNRFPKREKRLREGGKYATPVNRKRGAYNRQENCARERRGVSM